jgi:hypothetical protein
VRNKRFVACQKREAVDGRGEQCAARRVVEIADAAAAVRRVGVEAVYIVFEQTVGLLEAR